MFKKQIFKEFHYKMVYKTILHIAIEKANIEIVKLLLDNPNIDVNNYMK